MKRVAIMTVLAFVVTAFMAGCATSYPVGCAYTQLKLPVAVTDNSGKSTKVGTAECKSLLYLIATGDASIDTAKKSAGITKVHHVDWEVENILGLIGTYKVIVYGE
jgi:hypothetical protein